VALPIGALPVGVDQSLDGAAADDRQSGDGRLAVHFVGAGAFRRERLDERADLRSCGGFDDHWGS
jgi:hypothetical protein